MRARFHLHRLMIGTRQLVRTSLIVFALLVCAGAGALAATSGVLTSRAAHGFVLHHTAIPRKLRHQSTRAGKTGVLMTSSPAARALSIALGFKLGGQELARVHRLASHAMRVARVQSRLAYTDLRRVDAQSLLRARFSRELRAALADPTAAMAHRVVAYRSDSEAIVRASNGKLELAESSIPLLSSFGSGHDEPVSLSLRGTAAGFAPQNPIVPVTFGRRFSQGVTIGAEQPPRVLGSQSVGLFPDSGSTGDAVGSPLAGGVFYRDVAIDTDLEAVPASRGFELFEQLRSRRSPTRLLYRVQLPAGAVLRTSPGGGVAIVRGGQTLIVVHAPVATDSQGQSVPAELSIVDSEHIAITVKHRHADVDYPILVDPIVENWALYANGGNGWLFGNNLQGLSEWDSQSYDYATGQLYTDAFGDGFYPTTTCNPSLESGSSCYNGSQTRGLQLYESTAMGNDQAYSEWAYMPAGGLTLPSASLNRTTYISEFDLYDVVLNMHSNPGSSWPTTYIDALLWDNCNNIYAANHTIGAGFLSEYSLVDGAGATAGANTKCAKAAGFAIDTQAPSQAPYPPGTVTNRTDWVDAYLGGAVIYLEDPDAASFASVSHSNSAVQNAGWDDPTAGGAQATDTVTANVQDPGLGVQWTGLYASGGSSWKQIADSQPVAAGQSTANPPLYATAPSPEPAYCSGLHNSLCPNADTVHFTYTLPSNLSEGANQALDNLVVGDPLSRVGEAGHGTVGPTWSVNVDLHPPATTLSGGLWNGRTSVLGSTAVTPLTNATYPLTVSSTDNYAGVAETDISVDGGTPSVYRNSCTSVQCNHTETVNYTFDSEEYGPRQCQNELPAVAPTGCHTITVTTKDWLGANDGLTSHDTTTTFDVYTAPPAVQSGQPSLLQNDQLGLENFWDFREFPTGAGSELRVNEGNGNLVWDDTPMVDPGQGLSTFVTVAYNSQHRLGDLDPLSGLPLLPNLEYDQIGQGFSLGIDGLTRLNEPLDLSDASIGAKSQISFTTVYGTRETFLADPSHTGQWIAPPGVFLHLRQYSALNSTGVPTDPEQTWAITRPDGVTFFFDNAGYESSIEDRTGNTITFKRQYNILNATTGALSSCATADIEQLPLFASSVCGERVYEIDDQNETARESAHEHKFTVCYYDPNPSGDEPGCPTADKDSTSTDPQYLKVADITDHASRVLHFSYRQDGSVAGGAADLASMTMNSQDAAGSAQQQVFNFGFGASGQDTNPAASLPALEPLVPSGLLFPNGLTSVEDPNGNSTQIYYTAPTASTSPCPNDQTSLAGSLTSLTGLEPKCVSKIVDRERGETDFAYSTTTDALSGTADYGQPLHLTTVNGPRIVMQGTTATRPDNWADEIDGTLRPIIQENPVQTADTTGGHGLTLLSWGSSGNSGNQLTSLIDAYGETDQTTTTFQYDSNGRLTDRRGPSLTTDTNTREVTVSYQQSAGMLIAPSKYDANGTFVSDPLTLKDQDGNTYTFNLDSVPPAGDGTIREDGLVTSVSDQTHATWTTSYQKGPSGTIEDGGGLVTSQSTPGNPATTFSTFDPNGLPQVQTDPADGSKYPDGTPIGGGTTRYSYDAVGDLLTVADQRNPTGTIGSPMCTSSTTTVPSYTTVFTYDDLQRVSEECDSKDSTANPNGQSSGVVRSVETYDPNGNELTATDGSGNVTTYTHNPMDWLTAQTTAAGYTTSYAFDRNGDLIDRKEPSANAAGPVVAALGVPSGEDGTSQSPAPGVSTSSNGHETLFAYDGAGDQLAADQLNPGNTTVDPDYLTTYGYDDRRDQVGVADPASNATIAKAISSGQITPAQLTQAIGNANIGANPLNPTGTSWRTATAYDGSGNPVQVVTNPDSADGATSFIYERRQYDADGNLLADQDGRYSGSIPSTDGLGGFDLSDGSGNPIARNIAAYGYDSRGLLIQQTDPAGDEMLYGRLPDGKICWTMSPNGVAYQQSQGASLPVSTDCSTKTQGLPYTTSYTYTAPGWLATIGLPTAPNEYSYPAALQISYERDQAGYPLVITDAEGNKFTNTFYDNGELKSTGRPSWWAYDPSGQGQPGPDPNDGQDGQASSDTPGAGLAIREKTLPEQYQAAKQEQGGPTLPPTQGAGDFGSVPPNPLPGILPRAGQTSLSYTGSGALQSVTDTEGNSTTLTYNPDEQLHELDQPCGCQPEGSAGATIADSVTSYIYDPDGNVSSVTTPEVHELTGATGSSVTDLTTLSSTVDQAETTTYSYDALDRQIQESGPGDNAGNKSNAISGGYPKEITYTSYQLEPGGQVNGQGFGHTTSFNVSELMSVTDARGDTAAAAGGAGQWGSGPGDLKHTTTSDYDALGNLIEQTGPQTSHSPSSDTLERETTTYEYDQLGDQTRVVRPLGNESGATQSDYATTNAYTPDGQLSSSTDATSDTTSYGYDPDGNISVISRPSSDSGGDPQVTAYTYNGRDLPWTTSTGLAQSDSTLSTTSNSRTTVTEYDGNGNLRRTVEPAGVAPTAASGPGNTPKNGDAYYSYDGSYGDLSASTSPATSTTGQDANIDATIRVYDNQNDLTSVYQPWGCDPSDVSQPTKCTTNAITDNRRFGQQFQRDDRGFIKTQTGSYDWTNSKSAKVQTGYTYLPNGWIASQTDPTYAAPGTSETISYYYDPSGNETEWDVKGVLSGHTGACSAANEILCRTTTRVYYPDGQLAQIQGTGNGTDSHEYSYYHLPTGQLDYVQMSQDSNGTSEAQNLSYDNAGRLTALQDLVELGGQGVNAYDTRQSYDLDGNITQRWLNGNIAANGFVGNNATSTTYTYDHDDRETNMAVAPMDPSNPGWTPASCPTSSSQPCRTFTTTYFPSGQVRELQRSQDGGSTITEDYTYNNDGTLKSDVRDPSDNKNVTYGYDTNGNRTQDERGTHTFNALNQEVEWKRGGPDTQAPGSTVTYTLDGDGSLLQKVEQTYVDGIGQPEPNSPNLTYDESINTTTQYCSQATASQTQVDNQDASKCQHDQGRVENISSHEVSTVTAVHNNPGGDQITNPPALDTTYNYCYDQLGENRRIVKAQDASTNACPSDPLANGLQGEDANTTTLYTYDAFEREHTATGPDPASANPSSPRIDTETYYYDALDRRYAKTVSESDGTNKAYGYSYIADTNNPTLDYNINGSGVVTEDLYDYNSADQRTGVYSLSTAGASAYHSYALDANGSVEALENKDGTISTGNRYHYDPYGNLEMGATQQQQVASSGNLGTATPENQLSTDAQANAFRFEGFYYDSGVETYDMQARPYRPDSGQYLTADRFEQALGDQELAADPLTQNRYAFAGGNPTSNVEYDGHRINCPGSCTNAESREIGTLQQQSVDRCAQDPTACVSPSNSGTSARPQITPATVEGVIDRVGQQLQNAVAFNASPTVIAALEHTLQTLGCQAPTKETPSQTAFAVGNCFARARGSVAAWAQTQTLAADRASAAQGRSSECYLPTPFGQIDMSCGTYNTLKDVSGAMSLVGPAAGLVTGARALTAAIRGCVEDCSGLLATLRSLIPGSGDATETGSNRLTSLGDALRNPSPEVKASAAESAGKIAGAATGIPGAGEMGQAVGALIKLGGGSISTGARAIALDIFNLAFDQQGLVEGYREAIASGFSQLSRTFP
jgi:RHS repeat-associated protein